RAGWVDPTLTLLRPATPHTRPASFVPGSDGTIWIIGLAEELIGLREGQLNRVSLPSVCQAATPLALSCDGGGGWWLGLEHGGLMVLRPSRVTTITHSQGLPDDNCWTI